MSCKSQLTPNREQPILHHMQLGDSPVTIPLTDLAKSLSKAIIFDFKYTHRVVLLLPPAVQINLDKPRYMNTNVYIRTNREEVKSKWLGFNKYSQINWELEQPWYLTYSHRLHYLGI